MFKRQVTHIDSLLNKVLREQGLETPLLQRRLIAAWPDVMGEMVAGYTRQIFIKNQTLMVQIENPALRQNLSMTRSQLVGKLNSWVGAPVITEVKFF